MNYSKSFAALAVAIAATATMATVPEVSNVTMTQNLSSRLVTITYQLTGPAVVTLDILTNATANASTGWASIGGEHICNAQGAVWRKVTDADANNGVCTITWQPTESWLDGNGDGFKVGDGRAKARVSAWPLDNTPDYMVVDISASAQPGTQKYYPAVDFLPGGLLGNPDYRTTSIVMRKIMAKDVEWTMGSTGLETARHTGREATHKVALTNNYYIGVFEVTQSQWGLIQSSRPQPSSFTNATDRAMRPVETVSYGDIRNNYSAAYDWPADPSPDAFLGKLKTKSGILFDLPSEAQWEFAARAGNGDTKWGDGSGIMNSETDANLDRLGRYKMNGGLVDGAIAPGTSCGAENGTAIVGSYAPNDWGLYDMAGNVREWCLDWQADNISAIGGMVNIDPSAPANTLSNTSAAGVSRMLRGGCYSKVAGECRPAFREHGNPTGRFNINGFRLLCRAGLR